MRVRLLFPDRDFDPAVPLPPWAREVIRDLRLDPVFDAMAAEDPYLRELVPKVALAGLADPDAIRYRQEVFLDCLAHADVLEGMRALALRALAAERELWGFGDSPSSVLYRATRLLDQLLPTLRALRALGGAHCAEFRSRGMQRLLDELLREIDAPFFAEAEAERAELELPRGELVSARLGPGNKGEDYVLHRGPVERSGWWRRAWPRRRSELTFEVDDDDETGHRALAQLKDRGLAASARAVADANAHVLTYLDGLRAELGFYLAVRTLTARLAALGAPFVRPEPRPTAENALAADGLYDLGLALTSPRPVVPNDVRADGRPLLVVSGPNQGGKTTFLRSLGIAFLLMQCGSWVPARRWVASVPTVLRTHFKREEDPALRGGKLNEELERMSATVEALRAGGLLLANESFASTSEREGSLLADGVTRGLLDGGVRVVYVTHLYDLTRRLYREEAERGLFLRAERAPDGARTFRVLPAPPLSTSFAVDLYRQVFGDPGAPE